MRVISGTLRGKKLHSLDGNITRPTLDRVKESVFNILQFKIKNSYVLDLFSGSGSLAIEALSREAKFAILCDSSKEAINIINKNVEDTRLKQKTKVICKDYIETLDLLKKQSIKFDLIFLDPPYKEEYAKIAIEKIIEYNLLQEDGIIIVETDDKNKIEDIKKIKQIEVYDIRKYGIVHILFIRKE